MEDIKAAMCENVRNKDNFVKMSLNTKKEKTKIRGTQKNLARDDIEARRDLTIMHYQRDLQKPLYWQLFCLVLHMQKTILDVKTTPEIFLRGSSCKLYESVQLDTFLIRTLICCNSKARSEALQL